MPLFIYVFLELLVGITLSVIISQRAFPPFDHGSATAKIVLTIFITLWVLFFGGTIALYCCTTQDYETHEDLVVQTLKFGDGTSQQVVVLGTEIITLSGKIYEPNTKIKIYRHLPEKNGFVFLPLEDWQSEVMKGK